MYKLIVLFAMAAVCLAAPRPSGLVAYSAPVYSPAVVSHVPVAYSSQSSSVIHSAPVVHSVASVPVHSVASVPVHSVASVPVHSVPLTYVAGPLVW